MDRHSSLCALAELQLGKLSAAHKKLLRLVDVLAQGVLPSSTTRYQMQRYVGIYTTYASVVCLTGRPERALVMVEEMILQTGQTEHLMGHSHLLALAALPLALWNGKIGAVEGYSFALRSNLECEHIALWEPVLHFYTSYLRDMQGDSSAINDMRLAVEELVSDKFVMRAPNYYGLLAEAFLRTNETAKPARPLNARSHFKARRRSIGASQSSSELRRRQ